MDLTIYKDINVECKYANIPFNLIAVFIFLKQFQAETSLVTYHSSYNSDKTIQTACGIAVCPLKTEV